MSNPKIGREEKRKDGCMSNKEDDIKRRYVVGCVRAFLEGKKNLNWVMAFVRGHHLTKSELGDILTKARPNADNARYDELLSACREQGLL